MLLRSKLPQEELQALLWDINYMIGVNKMVSDRQDNITVVSSNKEVPTEILIQLICESVYTLLVTEA